LLATHNLVPADSLDPAFIAQVLEPYRPTRTDYLRIASVIQSCLWDDGADERPILTLRGRYSIPTSCYIRNTGHFNAVEFLICYNQLAYVAFGHIFRARMLEEDGLTNVSPAVRDQLSKMTFEDFRRHQLSSMLILKTSTRFKAPISAESFTGELQLLKFFYRNRTCFATSFCTFRDDYGGYAEGEVLLGYPLGPHAVLADSILP
jgi:hypothetical protein